MKTKFFRTWTIFLMLTCITISAFSQSDAELKTKISKMNKEMSQAIVEGNSEKSLSYYVQDAVSLPNYGKMAQGIEAIKKSQDEMMASGMKFSSFEFNTLMVKSYGNLVTEIGTYQMSATMPGMTEPMQDQGKYLTLWEKQPDGSLKIKVETWNTDNNPMMAEKK